MSGNCARCFIYVETMILGVETINIEKKTLPGKTSKEWRRRLRIHYLLLDVDRFYSIVYLIHFSTDPDGYFTVWQLKIG
ncbi:unnamed protein product [Nippostrongylus brasiliensis]|uniref:Transposase n=1 Tax=Nippostrongylus brasiliensis TaxID=27835 RepID=A0A0N4YG69_NIPBR|nr:unnamed protein product [Nippostrongylus brasiliensis]